MKTKVEISGIFNDYEDKYETIVVELELTEEKIKNLPKNYRVKYPIKIIRKDDNEIFTHLGDGMYRTEWGNNNGSISETPLRAFNENYFEFIFAEKEN